MRTCRSAILACALFFLGSCTAPPPPDFKSKATIKEIMDSVVDPSADVIWESVSTTISARGTEEKFPRNDEEWKGVRRAAIQLMEGTNLLLIPGRRVAQSGEKSEAPNIELEPEQIEALINQDRETWQKLAHGLYDSVIPVLAAIDKKSAEELLNTSDAIDRACETCHLKYWYPNEARNPQLQEGPKDAEKK